MNIIPTRQRGFSLLEVLIAVAILAFGLLAITSLQASLVRSSAEVKQRSVALSLAKDRIEELRSFNTLKCEPSPCGTDESDYYTSVADSGPTTLAVGEFNYTVRTEVTRYAFDKNAGAFEAISNETTSTLPAEYAAENEFKRISITVGWTDATGQPQTVVVEDAIGSVAPENTGKLARRNPDAADRKPQILITNPALDPGVIPIAIGDGSETAATNPRPEVAVGTSRQTNFDIYTYAALNNSTNARAQSRVETSIIGCTCDKGQASNTAVDFRPTVWDGEKYAEPDEATGYSVQAGPANLNGPNAQSVLCTACCRDHHDPSGVAAPKFSPRLNAHNHYNTDLTTPSNGVYKEACRLIRVNGVFRVAADPYNEYTNILKTGVASGETAPFTATVPDSTASSAYVDFVIDYLETQADQTNPNTQLSQTVADDKADAAGLNDATQTFQVDGVRWLHARGLYMDYLEADALDAISESAADCAEGLTESQCLLRVLPFTSINVTELAAWTPKTGQSTTLAVENNLFSTSVTNPLPVRGRVIGLGTGTDVQATATIRTSNTGLLADPDYTISLADADDQTDNVDDQPDADGQGFTITGPACGITSTTQTINRGGTSHDFTTASQCAASDSTKGGATQIVVKLTPTAGSTSAKLDLIGPNGTVYPLVTTSTGFTSMPTSFTIPASSVGASPLPASFWSLRVTNTRSGGSSDSFQLAWSMEFVYATTFTATLTDYAFGDNTTEKVSGSITPGTGSCSFASATLSTTCVTTLGNAALTWAISKYNYKYTTSTYRNVSCPAATQQSGVCSINVYCKNYGVESVSGMGATIVSGSVTNDGKINESTQISFPNGVTQGGTVTVDFLQDTELAPVCTANSNKCNQQTWACQ